MSGDLLTITLDNPSLTYYSGQTVTGSVHVKLTKVKKCRGVRIKIKGVANTRWTVSRRGRRGNNRQTFTGHEEYFKLEYYLIGSESGPQIELSPGNYKYSFSYTLPQSLPSSFESRYGHIRYTVKATIDRPRKFDHEAVKAFTILSLVDLNQEPNASMPVRLEKSKRFCCFCCTSQSLTIGLSLPVRGYVPGQDIPVEAHFENVSQITIYKLKLQLYKKLVLHADKPRKRTKVEREVISEVHKGPFVGNATDQYLQLVKVPPLPPSNLKHCEIIDLNYYLKIEACMSGWCKRNLKDKIEVYIGTVPLRNYQMPIPAQYNEPQSSTQYSNFSQISAPSGMGFTMPTAEPSAPPYLELPPPTYEESMFNALTLKEEGDSDYISGVDTNFSPRYPVYNFPATYSKK